MSTAVHWLYRRRLQILGGYDPIHEAKPERRPARGRGALSNLPIGAGRNSLS